MKREKQELKNFFLKVLPFCRKHSPLDVPDLGGSTVVKGTYTRRYSVSAIVQDGEALPVRPDSLHVGLLICSDRDLVYISKFKI